MHPSVLKLFRLFAFTATLGGVFILAIGYAALPAEIPVTRWSVAAKTPLLVLRVPLINLLTLLLILVLERSLVRAHAGSRFRDNAMMTLTALFATLGVKSFFESFELLVLPTVFPWLPWLLLLLVVAGLLIATLTGMPFLRKTSEPRPYFNAREKLLAAVVVGGILGLQFLPRFMESLS
jgi:hypothetical protein